MNRPGLHGFHEKLGARSMEINGLAVAADYGDPTAEHAALRQTCGWLDLSARSRLCLAGGDRQSFLNGQVTNNVKDLQLNEGCYAALITNKGKMVSDLNIYSFEDEILLDFEPGYSRIVAERLEKYIVADDVLVVDVGAGCSLLSVQGPRAEEALRNFPWKTGLPPKPRSVAPWPHHQFGELYLMRLARIGSAGFDFFVPAAHLEWAMQTLHAAVQKAGGRPCGWTALETSRIEAGVPRFGMDMDETNLPPEAGLEETAISYTKGCYIGQEVISRLRAHGQVSKALRGLLLPDSAAPLPARGDKLLITDKEIGYITSAVFSPARQQKIALGYVRRESNQVGTQLVVRTGETSQTARIVPLPFLKNSA